MKRKRICGILFGYTIERINYTMFVLKLIKKWLAHTCVYFTVVTLIYMIIQAIVNVNDEALLLDAGRTALFFLFSLLIALANTVFSIDKLITALKVAIHFVLVMFAFYACLLLPLSMPGILSGITMVFVPAVSTFYISQKLGGTDTVLIGDIIDLQFLGNTYNPNLGSAISLVLMVIVLLCMSIVGDTEDETMGGRIR